jgi:cellobiose PTS system EIIC component
VPSTEQPAERLSLRDRIVPAIRAFAESRQMVAIQWALPISFVGLFVGLVVFMSTQPEPTLLLRFSHSFTAAFGVMSMVLVVVLSYDLAKRREISPAFPTAIAFIAFVLSLPFEKSTSFATLMKTLGSSGLFLAIGIALVTDALLGVGRKRLGPIAGSALGAALIVGAAAALMLLHVSLTSGLNAAISPLGNLGDSLTALLILTLVETLLWTIGIHGPALLAPVVLPVYINLQLQNQEAFAHGLPLPHIVTVSMFLFVFPGGAGGTLPLVILLTRSKVKRIRTVALATLLPSLANVNEPLMFGLPLVLNPVLGVPFVVTPVVLAIVSWWAMNLGLVARTIYYVPSAIPIPFGAFVATNDWRSVVLMLLNIAIGAAIYAPFVAIYERNERKRANAAPSGA